MRVKIPDSVTHRCLRPGCAGQMRPLKHTVFVGESGEAMVDTTCSRRCGMSSLETWQWR